MTPEPGRQGQVVRIVGHDDTARAMGSGDLEVLATPRLVAWCEAATCASIDEVLDDGSASVGTRVQIDHVAASAPGAQITVTATLTAVDGRLLRFEVAARDDDGRVVGHGEVRRVVVRRERFLQRLT
ncbi:MAG: thioesterase family protein [Nocardioidaceae bacterium]